MTATSPKKRTTVRTNIGFALWPLRAAFAIVEVVAPGRGADLALRLWCTPPRRRRRSRSATAGTGGAVPDAVTAAVGDGDRFDVRLDGRTVAARSWGAAGDPLVYLVHGWGGQWSQLRRFIPPLVVAGYRVVAFDALGHGASDPGVLGGRRASGQEFATTLAGVVATVGPAHALVGHSLGGAASALAVLDGLRTRRLVLVAAPADPMAFLDSFVDVLRVGRRTRTGLMDRMLRLAGRPLDDFNTPHRLRNLPGGAVLPPTLVVHDRNDKEVCHTDAVVIADAWPGAELLTTSGLGHRRILRDAYVVDQVSAFIGCGHRSGNVPPDREPAAQVQAPAPAPAPASASASALKAEAR